MGRPRLLLRVERGKDKEADDGCYKNSDIRGLHRALFVPSQLVFTTIWRLVVQTEQQVSDCQFPATARQGVVRTAVNLLLTVWETAAATIPVLEWYCCYYRSVLPLAPVPFKPPFLSFTPLISASLSTPLCTPESVPPPAFFFPCLND